MNERQPGLRSRLRLLSLPGLENAPKRWVRGERERSARRKAQLGFEDVARDGAVRVRYEEVGVPAADIALVVGAQATLTEVRREQPLAWRAWRRPHLGESLTRGFELRADKLAEVGDPVVGWAWSASTEGSPAR